MLDLQRFTSQGSNPEPSINPPVFVGSVSSVITRRVFPEAPTPAVTSEWTESAGWTENDPWIE